MDDTDDDILREMNMNLRAASIEQQVNPASAPWAMQKSQSRLQGGWYRGRHIILGTVSCYHLMLDRRTYARIYVKACRGNRLLELSQVRSIMTTVHLPTQLPPKVLRWLITLPPEGVKAVMEPELVRLAMLPSA